MTEPQRHTCRQTGPGQGPCEVCILDDACARIEAIPTPHSVAFITESEQISWQLGFEAALNLAKCAVRAND